MVSSLSKTTVSVPLDGSLRLFERKGRKGDRARRKRLGDQDSVSKLC